MKHEHDVNVKLPAEVQQVKQHVQMHKNTYLGVGAGLLVGLVIGRHSMSTTKIVVVVTELPSPVSYF